MSHFTATQNALTQPLPAQLDGRTVVIFGGTSGIGLAAATQAKAAGAFVTVIGSNAERAEQAALEHGLAGWRVADVTHSEAIYTALADIPHVDHLVLLAGTFVGGKVLDAEIDHLRRAFEERMWASCTPFARSGIVCPRTAPSPLSLAAWPTGPMRTALLCSLLLRPRWKHWHVA